MRRILIALVIVLAIVIPGLIPTVSVTTSTETPAGITTAAPTAGTALDLSLVGIRVSVSPGGEARAWNLIYELCRAGVPGMCDLYMDGLGLWW